MIGTKIELNNLIKICNSDIKIKCTDESEKIRKEIMIKLQSSNKIIGIIAHSNLYVSSIELYKIEYDVAVSLGYLNLCCRENNKLFYYLSKDVNVMTSGKETKYNNFTNAADIVLYDLFNNL